MNLSNVVLDACVEELLKIASPLLPVLARGTQSVVRQAAPAAETAGRTVADRARAFLGTTAGQAAAAAAPGAALGAVGGAAATDGSPGGMLAGATGGALLGAGGLRAGKAGLRHAVAARAARQAKMVDDLALKQTTERLGGNTATAEKFLAGTKGDRLREAAKGSLQGRPEYEHLFPQFPGTSAFLSKMGI